MMWWWWRVLETKRNVQQENMSSAKLKKDPFVLASDTRAQNISFFCQRRVTDTHRQRAADYKWTASYVCSRLISSDRLFTSAGRSFHFHLIVLMRSELFAHTSVVVLALGDLFAPFGVRGVGGWVGGWREAAKELCDHLEIRVKRRLIARRRHEIKLAPFSTLCVLIFAAEKRDEDAFVAFGN